MPAASRWVTIDEARLVRGGVARAELGRIAKVLIKLGLIENFSGALELIHS